jgi:hypothetical protein
MSATSAPTARTEARHLPADGDRDSIRPATGTGATAGFYALACAIAWGWSFALLAAGQTVRRGHVWPTHFVALLAPAIAAFAVIAWLRGRRGVGHLARRLARWRIGARGGRSRSARSRS